MTRRSGSVRTRRTSTSGRSRSAPSRSEMTDTHGTVDHLFRHSAGQMVATLTRIFGPEHLSLAEEVVQEALIAALQQWGIGGVPENPRGWLFKVARNRALDQLRRESTLRGKEPEIVAAFQEWRTGNPASPDRQDCLS